MTLSLDIRRMGLMLLTLLLAMAVVGPSCLIFASHAFAMPEHAPKGCEDSGSSLSGCPHEDPSETTVVTSDKTPIVSVVVPAGPVDTPSFELGVAVQTEQPSGAPVAHLTPLRI